MLGLTSILWAKTGGKIFLWLVHFEKYLLNGEILAFRFWFASCIKILKIEIFLKIHTKRWVFMRWTVFARIFNHVIGWGWYFTWVRTIPQVNFPYKATHIQKCQEKMLFLGRSEILFSRHIFLYSVRPKKNILSRHFRKWVALYWKFTWRIILTHVKYQPQPIT